MSKKYESENLELLKKSELLDKLPDRHNTEIPKETRRKVKSIRASQRML